MKIACLASIIFSMCSLSSLDGMQIADNDFKRVIKQQHQLIEQANPQDKSELLEKLALLYLKDQEQEQAFAIFLQSLEFVKPQDPTNSTDNLDTTYRRALTAYLESHGEATPQSAKQIIDEFGPAVKSQPAPIPLGFLVAIAYANLHRYEDFFGLFYITYVAYPEHYLAYKTKAILHIKLMERKRTEADRKLQREAVLHNLNQALTREPNDTTIYKLLITFSSPENRKLQIQHCIEKILRQNVQIPRTEIMFYVQETADNQSYVLAQQFIDRAHQWYQNSRIVTNAQTYLDFQIKLRNAPYSDCD